jgi:hypothetical protein
MTIYGSGGSVSAMSGPVVGYAYYQVESFYATEIYCKGASVSSCVVIGEAPPIGNVAHAGPGFTVGSPVQKMKGPNAATPDWVGLAGAVLIALLLIGSLLVVDRKRSTK